MKSIGEEDSEQMPGTDDIDAMLEEMFEAQGMKPAVRANIMKLHIQDVISSVVPNHCGNV